MNISDIAVKVRINISCWGAEKTDRDVTQEVLNQKMADPDGGKFIKSLLGGKSNSLNNIKKFSQSCRVQLSTLTMPMGNSTYYFPIDVMQEILDMLKRNERRFYELEDTFIDEYPDIIQSIRESDSELLDESQCLTIDKARGKFRYSYIVEPIAPNNGFDKKFNFGDLEEELKQQYERKMEEIFEQGENLIIGRLAERVSKLKTSIEGFTGKGGIRQDMLDKSLKITEVVKKLNVKNNGALTDWCRRARESFEVPALSYRENIALRNSAVINLGGILREMGGEIIEEVEEDEVVEPETQTVPIEETQPTFDKKSLDNAFSNI